MSAATGVVVAVTSVWLSTSLTALADEQQALARTAHSGRAAHTVYGGHEHTLRQTLLALLAVLLTVVSPRQPRP